MTTRNRAARIIALSLVILTSLCILPVARTGQLAFDRAYARSYQESQQWLDDHARRADRVIPLYYALAFLALAAIFGILDVFSG